MNLATIQVSGVQALAKKHEQIPAGIVGATVTFEFTDPRWEGLTKTAVFRGCVTRDVIMDGNSVVIPYETVEHPGKKLLVGVFGVDADKNLQIPTVWASLGMICAGADPTGDPSTDPALPVWAQLQEDIAALKNSQSGGDDVDLTGYATEQYVQNYAQPKGNYLTEHQDISGKLDADKLPEAVNDALAQAKASGEFDGADGQPGEKGDKGDTGAQGEPGKDGSDANVTAENIVNALGYIPANEDELPEAVTEIIESLEQEKENLFSFKNAQTNLAQLSKNKPTTAYIAQQAQSWGYKDTENEYFVFTPSGYNVGIIGGLSLPLQSGNYKIRAELYIPITEEATRTTVKFGVFVAPSVYASYDEFDLTERGKWVKCEKIFTVSDGDTHVYPIGTGSPSSTVFATTFYARNICIASLDPVQKGLLGKKWVAVGDSHTEQNSHATKRYYDYIAEQSGIAVTVNGLSGSGYKAKEDVNNAYYQRVLNLPTDTEVVTLFTSNNDVSLGVEIGTYADTTTDTICGCLNKTIDNLFSVLPTVKLGVITNVPPQSYTPMSTAENANEKLADAVAELCKRRGIPCLDLFHSSGLRPWDENFRNLCYKHDTSGGHFDEDGHAFIAPRIKALLESIIM